MTEKHDLTTGPVGSHLFRQAAPFALSLVALFSLRIDTVFHCKPFFKV